MFQEKHKKDTVNVADGKATGGLANGLDTNRYNLYVTFLRTFFVVSFFANTIFRLVIVSNLLPLNMV